MFCCWEFCPSGSSTEARNVLSIDLYRQRDGKLEKHGSTTQALVLWYVKAVMYLSMKLKVSERFLCEKLLNAHVPDRYYDIDEAQLLDDYKEIVCPQIEESPMRN